MGLSARFFCRKLLSSSHLQQGKRLLETNRCRKLFPGRDLRARLGVLLGSIRVLGGRNDRRVATAHRCCCTACRPRRGARVRFSKSEPPGRGHTRTYTPVSISKSASLLKVENRPLGSMFSEKRLGDNVTRGRVATKSSQMAEPTAENRRCYAFTSATGSRRFELRHGNIGHPAHNLRARKGLRRLRRETKVLRDGV